MHQRFRQPRLELGCCKAWRTVSYDTDSTIPSPQRHQPIGQQPQGPALVALGWGAAGQRDQLGLLGPVQAAAVGARGRFAVDRGVQPGRDVVQADPGHGGRVDLQCGPDGGVGP
jgi:hypothetical protein